MMPFQQDSHSQGANRSTGGNVVAIDCRYICDKPSGIGPYVQALVDNLPELAPDLRFVFLKHPKAGRLSSCPNVREVVFHHEATGPTTMWLMPEFFEFDGIHLFHATFNIHPARIPIPVVTTIHDVMWMNHPEWARRPGWWGRVETAYYQHGIRRALKESVRIAAISRATIAEIASLDADAAARSRLTYYGVSDDWRPPKDEMERHSVISARNRWIPGAQRWVLTVGQFAGYKNHERVVRAFARAFPDDMSTHLVLVQRLGEGSRRLAPVISELGLERRVHFLRDVPFEELRALFWGAMALCHPSLCEGFGNPPSEALASGCPVITSNRSSMPEVSGGAAILVDPESDEAIAAAMRRIADHPDIAVELRVAGFEKIRSFRWRSTAERTLAIYREVLG